MTKERTTLFWISAGALALFFIIKIAINLPTIFDIQQKGIFLTTGIIVILVVLFDRLFKHLGS